MFVVVSLLLLLLDFFQVNDLNKNDGNVFEHKHLLQVIGQIFGKILIRYSEKLYRNGGIVVGLWNTERLVCITFAQSLCEKAFSVSPIINPAAKWRTIFLLIEHRPSNHRQKFASCIENASKSHTKNCTIVLTNGMNFNRIHRVQ